MDVVRSAYHIIRSAFPINRVVALLTPLYAAAAAAVAAYAFQKLPWLGGVIDQEQITAIIGATALAALTAGYKWLDNWGKYEERRAIVGDNPLDREEGPMIHSDDFSEEETQDGEYPDEPPYQPEKR